LESVHRSNNETAASDHLQRARRLLAEGKYDSAFKENESALLLAERKPPGDQALFNMGRIAAASKNAGRDYPRALIHFNRLIREYPQSPLVEQARLWVEVLQEHQNVSQEKKALMQEKMALAREREKLNQSVEQSRKVDIEIEQKRRKVRAK
jgi:tetratricopeptide (TPR) repeat protein